MKKSEFTTTCQVLTPDEQPCSAPAEYIILDDGPTRVVCQDHATPSAWPLVTDTDYRTQARIQKFFALRGIQNVAFFHDGDEAVEHAVRQLRRDYQNDVTGLADEIEQRILRRETTNRDELQTAVQEAVDGTQRVIYTWQAKLGLLVSGNANKGLEEELVGASTFRDGIPWEVLMYWALEADVCDELQNKDTIQINEDDLGAPPEDTAGYIVDDRTFCDEHTADEDKTEPLKEGTNYVCVQCGFTFTA